MTQANHRTTTTANRTSKQRRTAIVLAGGLATSLVALSAHATVITTGTVFPGTLTTNPTTTSQIQIGFGGTTGSLEINASAAGNGFTTVTGNFFGSIGIVAGNGVGSVGSILINGNGSAGSATLTTKSIIAGVGGGNGTLSIQNGGLATAGALDSVVQAGNSASTGTIVVDGINSVLTSASRIQVGFADGSHGSMTVSNGALAQSGTNVQFSDGMVDIGSGDGATGSVTVTGNGSTLTTKGLIVGNSDVAGTITNAGTLTIQDGGSVSATAAGNFDGGLFVGSKTGSQVTVTGAGSTLQVGAITGPNFKAGKELIIGGFGQGTLLVDQSGTVTATGANVLVGGGSSGLNLDPGTLTVMNGGSVTANQIRVNQNGLLNGGGGTITADVVLNGGTIAPGNSPGTMTIDGDLTLLTGVLDIEIDLGISDLFDVSGEVFFGDDVTLNLIFLAAPSSGEIIDIEDFFVGFTAMNFDADFDLASQLQVAGLSSGSSIIVTLGDERTAVAAAVPEPATLALFGMGLFGLAMARRRRAA